MNGKGHNGMAMSRVRAGLVPSFFTMANMFCGYYAILMAAHEHFILSAWLIVAAGILDTLDGKLARLTKTSSPFGVQYDSLADVISFGAAPAALSYFVYFKQWGTVGLLVSFIPLVFGSLRLARFNVRLKGFDKQFFEGLPIPAAAITISTFVIFTDYYWHNLRWGKVFFAILLLVSTLMITNIRYEKMPNFTLRSDRGNRIKILIVIVGTLLIFIFPQESFFPIAIIYVFSGITRSLIKLFSSEGVTDNQIQESQE